MFINLFARFRRDTGGNFAMTLAIAMLPLLLGAGVALDYSMAYRLKSRLQGAVDSATLAAGKELASLKDNEVRKLVRDIVQGNLSTEDERIQIAKLDIKIDRANMRLTVSSNAKMPTSFARIAGIKKIDYNAAASIQSAVGAVEAVLVLDNTGSMSVGGRIDALKVAATSFVDTMMKLNQYDQRAKVAIVPFSDYVNVGMSNRNASWISVQPDSEREVCGEKRDVISKSGCTTKTGTYYVDGVPQTGTWEECSSYEYGEPYQSCWKEETVWRGCVGSRDNPFNLRDGNYNKRVPGAMNVRCPSEITPLTANRNRLMDEIADMTTTGNTYIPAGLMWGWRAISKQAPYTEGVSASAAVKNRVTKAIVLMTDGDNTVSKAEDSHYHNGSDVVLTNDWTLAACDAIKKDGVQIFTVTFGNDVPAATKEIVKKCATTSNNYFDADDGTKLKAAFDQIASALLKLYLTQ